MIWEDLHKNQGFLYLLTNRLNQDCLENLFVVIRLNGGQDNVGLTKNLFTLSENLSECKDQLKVTETKNEELVQQREELEENIKDMKLSKVYKKNAELRQSAEDMGSKLEKLKKVHENLIASTEYNNLKRLKTKVQKEQTTASRWKRKYEELGKTIATLEERDFLATSHLKDRQCAGLQLREENKNKFSSKVRVTMMALHGEADISASKCSKVVDIVSRNLFGEKLKGPPSASSVLNFSDGGHHIAKQQVTESILDSEIFTLATDGTSREKQHYLERHIVLSNGKSMSLGYTEIASDTAISMLEQTVDILEELSRVHCSRTKTENLGDEIEKTLTEILKKMKSLMSDRASNMKAFDKQLAEYKNGILGEETSTNFLFCNTHFLLGISSEFEKALVTLDKTFVENGPALGRDKDASFARFASDAESSCLRLIRTTANDLGPHGDEKSGCRQEWLIYCDRLGLKSRFSSFRANRFNNVFENASAVIYHHFSHCTLSRKLLFSH